MKFIKHFFISILAFVYLVLEYIFWNNILKPIYLKLKSLRLYQKTMEWIKHQHKYIVLFIFILFFVASEILGIIALALLAEGMIFLFILLYVVKFIPVAVAFTILDNSKEQLLTIKWFSYVYRFTMKIITIIQTNKLFLKSKVFFEIMKNKISSIVEDLNLTFKSL